MRARNRRLLTVGIALVVAVGTPFVVNQLSLQPGDAAVRWLFEHNQVVKPPPDFNSLAATVSATNDVRVSVPDAPTALLDIYQPAARSAVPRPVIMWIHGGGFISSSKDITTDYAILLAAHGYVVGNLDYTIAPQARYPVPVRQANAGLRYLVTNAARYGGDPMRVFVGGDSAGSQIASQTAAVETNPSLSAAMGITPGVPSGAMRGALLFCGLYDMRTAANSGFPALRTFMWGYLGRRDWLNAPEVSQLSTTEQATRAYPPTLLTVGDADPFEPQGHEMVSTLQRLGVPVVSQFYTAAGLGHEYQFNFNYPQTRRFFQKTLDFLAQRSGQPEVS